MESFSTFLSFCLLRAARRFPEVADLQIYIRTSDIICNWVLNVAVQMAFTSKHRNQPFLYSKLKTNSDFILMHSASVDLTVVQRQVCTILTLQMG